MESEPGQPRRQLHGYLSTEAWNGWYGFAERYGVNVTALLEAIGVKLARLNVPENRLPTWIRQIVRDARVVASSRSSRRH